MKKGSYQDVMLANIDPPMKAARFEVDPEKIEELSKSILEVGQLQPILIRPVNGRYEIIAGHRRYLAVKALNQKTIKACILEQDDETTIIFRATENLAREDLSPVEEAQIYSDLVNVHKMTIDQIGKRMGKSAGVVRRRLDLLKMPPQLQAAIHKKQISWSVAEELWSLGDNSAIDYYLGFCIDHGVTQGVVRQWVHEWKAQQRQSTTGAAGGGQLMSPLESRPVYVSCDCCLGPMEIGDELVLRCCKTCAAKIQNALKGGS